MEFDKWSFKEKFFLIWGLSIATVAVLFVAVSLGNLISDNSANIASWVQAIGSILAIAGAAGIASWQISKEKQERFTENRQKEIHYCEICLQMCQAVFSVVRAAEAVEEKLTIAAKEKNEEKLEIHWARYTSVERIDNIQVSIVALLGKDMSSDLMKNVFSIQKYIAIYRESMVLAKLEAVSWRELDILQQKENLREEVERINRKLIAYRAQLSKSSIS